MTSSARSPAVRFCLTFGVLVVALFILVSIPGIESAIVVPFMGLTAASAAALLAFLGESLVRNGLTLSSSAGAIEIAHGCDVTYEWMLFAAAVFAFPVSGRARCLGLLVGLPLLFALNLVRVVTLFYLVTRWPDAFHAVHLYVWQTLFIAIVFGVWAIWARSALARSSRELAARTS